MCRECYHIWPRHASSRAEKATADAALDFSAAAGSAVTWRGNVQKAILIRAATLAIFFGGVSDAAEIRGRVVRIADGDTLTILSQATGTTGVPPVGEANTGTTGVSPVGGTITGTTGVPPVAL